MHPAKKNILLPVWLVFFLFLFTNASAQELAHYGAMVDPFDSEKCLTCHYGEENDDMRKCQIGCIIDPSSSHPVFRKYPPAGKELQYHPVKRLIENGIKLSDDKVTCLSCHDLLSDKEYLLVFENSSSRLCVACHIR